MNSAQQVHHNHMLIIMFELRRAIDILASTQYDGNKTTIEEM